MTRQLDRTRRRRRSLRRAQTQHERHRQRSPECHPSPHTNLQGVPRADVTPKRRPGRRRTSTSNFKLRTSNARSKTGKMTTMIRPARFLVASPWRFRRPCWAVFSPNSAAAARRRNRREIPRAPRSSRRRRARSPRADARRELRRPRRRLRRSAGAVRRAAIPSDNSLAVGPDHIVQIVNSRHGDLHEEGREVRHDGQGALRPGADEHVFAGFGGACEARNNGDAVVRYDQLADRWLIVMPIFSRAPLPRPGSSGRAAARARGDPAQLVKPGRRRGQPRPRGQVVRAAAAPPPAAARTPAAARRPVSAPARRPTGQRGAAAAARDRTRCATRSARRRIRSARTIATSSCGRSSPTIRGRRSGPTATTSRPAPATT